MKHKLDLLRYQDSLYIVLKRMNEDSVKDVSMAKEFFGADIALKHQGQIIFCEKIEEAEILD